MTEELQKAMYDFPTDLYGAKSVLKHPLEDSTHCLVHVKQSYVWDEDKIPHKLNSVRRSNISCVQGNVFDILADIREKTGLNEVYEECVTKEIVPNLEEYIDNFREARLHPGENFHLEDLYKKGGFVILPGDLEKFKVKAKEFYGKPLSPEYNKHMFFDRHLCLLNSIAQRNETSFMRMKNLLPRKNKNISVVVFGNGHAFGGSESFGDTYDLQGRIEVDSIGYWNEHNPKSKFSLIEITPNGL